MTKTVTKYNWHFSQRIKTRRKCYGGMNGEEIQSEQISWGVGWSMQITAEPF